MLKLHQHHHFTMLGSRRHTNYKTGHILVEMWTLGVPLGIVSQVPTERIARVCVKSNFGVKSVFIFFTAASCLLHHVVPQHTVGRGRGRRILYLVYRWVASEWSPR